MPSNIELDGEKQRKIPEHLPALPAPLPPPMKWHKDMEYGACSQFRTVLCCSVFLTLFPAPASVLSGRGCPSTGPPQDALPVRRTHCSVGSQWVAMPSECIYLHGWQSGYLLHHSLLHGLRGNICSTVISSRGFRGVTAMALGATPSLLHWPWYLQSSFTIFPYCLHLPFLKHFFLEAPSSLPMGSAEPCGQLVGAVWNWLCPVWGSPSFSLQSVLSPKACYQHQGIAFKFSINFQTMVNQSSFSELNGVKLCLLKNSTE